MIYFIVFLKRGLFCFAFSQEWLEQMWEGMALPVRDSQWRHGWLSSVEHLLVTWGWVCWVEGGATTSGWVGSGVWGEGGSLRGDVTCWPLCLSVPSLPAARLLCVARSPACLPKAVLKLLYLCPGARFLKSVEVWVCLWRLSGQAWGLKLDPRVATPCSQADLSLMGCWVFSAKRCLFSLAAELSPNQYKSISLEAPWWSIELGCISWLQKNTDKQFSLC